MLTLQTQQSLFPPGLKRRGGGGGGGGGGGWVGGFEQLEAVNAWGTYIDSLYYYPVLREDGKKGVLYRLPHTGQFSNHVHMDSRGSVSRCFTPSSGTRGACGPF